MQREEKLKFYPKHPSGAKTNLIETTQMPVLEQKFPFEVKTLYEEFVADADDFFSKYVDKRFEVTGIAKKIGPDIHNKPSIEISDAIDGKTYALVIFPTDDHYKRVKAGDTVVVRANYLVMSNHFGTVMKYSELVSVEKKESASRSSEMGGKIVLKHPFFDGEKVIENAAVVMEGGRITQIKQISETENVDGDYFLMPGLVDAHTHMGTLEQVDDMLKCGVTATCDVSASESLVQAAKPFTMFSSAGMTMGTLNGKSYVQKAINAGAKYIKILLMEPNLMLKGVLKDICSRAHDNGIKVAVHAVSVKAVKMSVESGVDILLHVPMKEEFPVELAKEIVEKGIAVAPTLVMMEKFAKSGRNGYKENHFKNAENAVKLLYENGVTILAATDANQGTFAPPMVYGSSMHRELELLVQAGMKPVDVLAAATGRVADAFGMENAAVIKEGKKATLLLIHGRPDKEITDIKNIKQVWIDGKSV